MLYSHEAESGWVLALGERLFQLVHSPALLHEGCIAWRAVTPVPIATGPVYEVEHCTVCTPYSVLYSLRTRYFYSYSVLYTSTPHFYSVLLLIGNDLSNRAIG